MLDYLKEKWLTVLIFIAIPTAVYFGNIEVQSYLGRQALNETGIVAKTLPEALDKAVSENKLVFVDVAAIWCSTCRRLDREIFANDLVREELERGFVFSRLEYETEEGQEFLQKRNVDTFPTLWVLEPDGTTVARLQVTFDPSQFIDQLSRSGKADVERLLGFGQSFILGEALRGDVQAPERLGPVATHWRRQGIGRARRLRLQVSRRHPTGLFAHPDPRPSSVL